jgi:hypothetical protein
MARARFSHRVPMEAPATGEWSLRVVIAGVNATPKAS